LRTQRELTVTHPALEHAAVASQAVFDSPLSERQIADCTTASTPVKRLRAFAQTFLFLHRKLACFQGQSARKRMLAARGKLVAQSLRKTGF
jgi:hypothetical protein